MGRRAFLQTVGLAGLGIRGLDSLAGMALAFDQSAAGVSRGGKPKREPPASSMKIARMAVTRVASPDRALLNSSGVHDTHFVRTILQLETNDGLTGIAEGAAGAAQPLEAVRAAVLGKDPFQLELFRMTVPNVAAYGMVEAACLDIIGQAIGHPVADLIGGRYRDSAEFSAYVFFVLPEGDDRGAITPEAVADQFLNFHRKYGFTSCKFKGGVLAPEKEIEALRLMRRAVPSARLRIDPNGGWSVETSLRVAAAIQELGMEYLEDPASGHDGMAEVRRGTRIPLATNMVVTRFADLPVAWRKESVDIILADHHYWGGLFNSRKLAGICETFGWGLSGHSNSHLGISMAVMAHLNCALPAVQYAADTHYPWTAQDIIQGSPFVFENGALRAPDKPGLGVQIDPGKMERLVANLGKVRSRREALLGWEPGYRKGRW
jgi:glucarate dehydratase